MNGSASLPRRAAWALVALILAGGFALVVARSQAPPAGPRPVVWDRESCAECRMAVSDRRFACQLQTGDGRVLDFDDPGCLFRYLAATDPPVHALYFRDFDQDRWLGRGQVAFIRTADSPMGYGLAAVAAGRPDALDYGAARARALSGEDSRASR